MWRSEANLQKYSLSFPTVGPGDGTRGIRFADGRLHAVLSEGLSLKVGSLYFLGQETGHSQRVYLPAVCFCAGDRVQVVTHAKHGLSHLASLPPPPTPLGIFWSQ